MSRTVNTYSIVQTRADGVRERLHLMPAGTTIGSAVDFPDFAVMGITGGGAAFEKYPTGLVKYDERTIKFHLDYMFAADPTLTSYILTPEYEGYVNVWTLSDDGGDPECALEDFDVRFRGMQIAQPTETYDSGVAGTTFTVKILHAARYLAENAVPSELADIIIAQLDTDYLTPDNLVRYNLYDLVYVQSDDLRVAVADSGKFSKEEGLGVYNQCAVMFKLSYLFTAIQIFMQKRYRQIMHDDEIEVYWDDSPSAHPHKTCTFYHSDVETGSLGDEATDLWFCGLIGEDGHSIGKMQYVAGLWIYTTSLLVGGYFLEPDKFRSYKSIHDWLMDISTNFGCKLTYKINILGDVGFRPEKVKQGTPIALSKSDFIREQKPYSRNADRIRGCDAEVSGAGSNDVSQAEYWQDGASENRPEGNVKILFHNLPSGEELSPSNSALTASNSPYWAPELGAFTNGWWHFSVKRNGFRSNVLYTEVVSSSMWPGAPTTPQLLRAHIQLHLSDGVGSHTEPASLAFPTLSVAGLLSSADTESACDLLQGYCVALQKINGLPYTICKANTRIFGLSTMLYEGTAKQELITPQCVGLVYDVSEFIHPALDGITPATAVLRKCTENRDQNNNLLPATVELFAF